MSWQLLLLQPGLTASVTFGRLEALMAKHGIETRDIRSGTYDPINRDGRPRSNQVRDKATPHEKAQWGADVRADPLPGTEPVLPEGLVRPPAGPLNPRTGRNKTK